MLRELASAFKGIIILKESRFTLLGHLRWIGFKVRYIDKINLYIFETAVGFGFRSQVCFLEMKIGGEKYRHTIPLKGGLLLYEKKILLRKVSTWAGTCSSTLKPQENTRTLWPFCGHWDLSHTIQSTQLATTYSQRAAIDIVYTPSGLAMTFVHSRKELSVTWCILVVNR
jgi:hypothetical protein